MTGAVMSRMKREISGVSYCGTKADAIANADSKANSKANAIANVDSNAGTDRETIPYTIAGINGSTVHYSCRTREKYIQTGQ